MPRTRKEIKACRGKGRGANFKYLNEWDAFSAKHYCTDACAAEMRGPKGNKACGEHWRPVLRPIVLQYNEKGEIWPTRMPAPEVKKLYKKIRGKFPKIMQEAPFLFDDPDRIFQDYVDYFGPTDGVEGPGVDNPLDLVAYRPVWDLYVLPQKNWKFTKDRQYSVENDKDDQTRNYEKICCVDNYNALILHNRCRSAPDGLKLNLHVTISQGERNGRKLEIPIIIDPDTDNDSDDFPPGSLP